MLVKAMLPETILERDIAANRIEELSLMINYEMKVNSRLCAIAFDLVLWNRLQVCTFDG